MLLVVVLESNGYVVCRRDGGVLRHKGDVIPHYRLHEALLNAIASVGRIMAPSVASVLVQRQKSWCAQ